MIEQKVSCNLMKMKEVMAKKINNDQYIISVANNKTGIEKNIQKLHKLPKDIKATVAEQIEKMDNRFLEGQLVEI
jgi:hypothetical protein